MTQQSVFSSLLLGNLDAASWLAALGASSAADPTIVALAAYNTNGLLTQTAADTFTGRTLTAPAAGFTITNPAGTAGNPTFVLANDLAAYEGLSTNGLVVRSATDTALTRSIGAGTGISVANGDGVSGNPTPSVDQTFSPTWTAVHAFSAKATLSAGFKLGSTSYTIASGVITLTKAGDVIVDTEAAAATDDLDTINGTAGDLIIVRSTNPNRDVTLKDGTGNLRLAGGDFVLDTTDDMIVLFERGGAFCELCRSNNT